MPGSFPYFIEGGRIDFLMIEKMAGKQLQKWEKIRAIPYSPLAIPPSFNWHILCSHIWVEV